MRRLLLLTALPALLISSAVLIGTGSSQALTSTGGGSARTHCPHTGKPATPSYRPPDPEIVPYLSGNPLYGPKDLPRHGTIGRMLAGYKRFDATSPAAFLSCFWNGTPYVNWRYPMHHGFNVFRGKPVTYVLHRNDEIDLFGNPGNPDDATKKGGQFLSPAGTLYKDRALPPTNLDTYDVRFPFNYHRYRVLKKFSVLSGPIAPWFDQPGGGTQDYLDKTTGPGLPPDPGIASLVHAGYVEDVTVGALVTAFKAGCRVIPCAQSTGERPT